jgi:hypothetical protein
MAVDTGSFSDVSQLTDSSSSGFDFQTHDPLITFQTKQVPPAVPVYITPDDFLRIQIISDAPLTTRIGTARVLRADGKIHTYELDVIVPTAFTTTTFDVALSEGWLLAVALIDQTQQLQRGQCFITIGIVRNPGANALWVYTLAADYLTYLVPAGYPGGQVTSSIQGEGLIKLVDMSPAVGAQMDFSVPAHTRYRLISLEITPTNAVSTRPLNGVVRLYLGAIFYTIALGAGPVPGASASFVLTADAERTSQSPGSAFNRFAGGPFAADTGFSELDGYYQELTCCTWLLQTSAVAGNRTPILRISDGSGNPVWFGLSPLSIPPSTTGRIVAGQGVTQYVAASGVDTCIPLPVGLRVPPGGNLVFSTINLQAGDLISALSAQYRLYNEVYRTVPIPTELSSVTRIQTFNVIAGAPDSISAQACVEQWLVP